MLGKDYTNSGDLAWTTSSDAQGFHILGAVEKEGYAWKTIASLSEPGFDADSWIGNACVTGSGKHAVVVYAPRTFTNKPELMARGAFTATIELGTGKITKLPLQASLAYYNPGCGVGEDVVLTQAGGEDKAATRLFTVDAATGAISKPIETTGQVTSAVMSKDGSVVGANGARIVKVDRNGKKTALLYTDSVPYQLMPDADGGLVFLDKLTDDRETKTSRTASADKNTAEPRTRAKRLTADQVGLPDGKTAKAAPLAEGPLTQTGLTANAGTVFLTGKAKSTPGSTLPRTLRQLAGVPKGARVSTRGEAVLTETSWTDGQGTLLRADEPTASRPVNVKLTVLDSRKVVEFTVDPTERTSPHVGEGHDRSPALTAPKAKGAKSQVPAAKSSVTYTRATATSVLAAGGSNEIVESERVCSVPRNDPRNQAMQPKPRQVEWAVNMAIRNKLDTHVSRPANWKNLGMPAYQPQSLFPYPADLLGGATIPAQVMLGITTQESNMWQASRSAVPGVTGNPLIGNYYGIDYYDGLPANDWDIDWAEADCGYGITQVTDHMRLAGREDGHGGAAWDYQKQRAVALDYTANIAAGLHILADKWHQTSSAGLKVNNGNSAKLENWTFALWAYNSGFYPNAGDAAPWGLGWANNPANPEWDASRSPFMEDSAGNEEAADAAHPQDWPYQEKVLGFAAHPPAFLESPGTMVPAFRAAWWNGKEGGASVEGSAVRNRALVKPPENTFCDPVKNSCNPGKISDNAQNEIDLGPCTRSDFKCWWNQSVQWKDDCDYSCGNDFTRFPVTWAEEPDGTAYPPSCSPAGIPSNALIVDDVPDGTPAVRPGCSNSSWTNQGSFSLDFGSGESACSLCYVKWPAKADLHQLGAGFGGHFYFGHTRANDAKGERLKFTGKWELGNTISEGQAEVFAHMPDHGAHTETAAYKIYTSNGVQTKVVKQKGDTNRWVSLGSYRFNDVKPKVELSTITTDGTGDEDIAFDAVAFVPGQYDKMPSISFSDPNVNAPQPDDITTPLDMTPDGVDLGDPDTSTRQEFSETKFTYASWCAAKPFGAGTSRKAWTNRTEGCVKGEFGFVKSVNGSVTGTATFAFQAEMKLHADSVGWNAALKFKLVGATGKVATEPIQVTVSDTCSLGCIKSGTRTEGGTNTWQFDKGDRHVYSMSQIWKWDEAGSSNLLFPRWAMTGEIGGIKADSSTDVSPGASTQIRCDSVVPQAYPGCVFDRFQPTYVMNSKKFPAAAAHAWLVQNKLPGHFGSRAHGKPLTYLGSYIMSPSNPAKKQTDVNREVICPTSWERNQNADLSQELNEGNPPKADTWSCDEFAFAASYDSAGMANGYNPVQSGDECLQVYAKRGGDGVWHLLSDPRYPLPDWNEKCGRATISNNQNTQSMRPFGQFIVRNRLMDKDKYWLDLDGFNP
ncbi:hypothetical protein OHB07_06120 [Streptomyces sp. NBC_00111]|uniref:golvesin C-terminal-like domain-containing protein n=1 Tax=Streptomyces sp. NBC_00111 TaxID=2975655 RepID=UPI003248779C